MASVAREFLDANTSPIFAAAQMALGLMYPSGHLQAGYTRENAVAAAIEACEREGADIGVADTDTVTHAVLIAEKREWV